MRSGNPNAPAEFAKSLDKERSAKCGAQGKPGAEAEVDYPVKHISWGACHIIRLAVY